MSSPHFPFSRPSLRVASQLCRLVSLRDAPDYLSGAILGWLVLVDLVYGEAHSSVRLPLDEHFDQSWNSLLFACPNGPLEGRFYVFGSCHSLAQGTHGFHDSDVVHAVGAARPLVGDVHPVVHVVLVLLRLPYEAHVAVVHHDQHVRNLVLDRYRYLFHQELEGVVPDDPDHEVVRLAELYPDARRDLPP